MALNTYTALKASISNWLNRSDLTSEISDDFLALAHADINSKLRVRAMQKLNLYQLDFYKLEIFIY